MEIGPIRIEPSAICAITCGHHDDDQQQVAGGGGDATAPIDPLEHIMDGPPDEVDPLAVAHVAPIDINARAAQGGAFRAGAMVVLAGTSMRKPESEGAPK